MFGYTITINGKDKANTGDICYNNIICSNTMINKFEQDKVFKETDNYIILLDGVVTNKKGLLEDSKCQWAETLIRLYESNGICFFRDLRGSFSGALYDKVKDRWIIFSDQLGSKFTYYAKVGDFFCCSEVMGRMYHMLKENGIAYHLSAENSMLLLTYGFMIGDRTLCEEIRKINPGCYITYQSGKLEEHRYYQINNSPDPNIEEKDAIEIIDHFFRQAVSREFEKDKEYGYKHLVALSGGLDCRMTSFVAHECGYTNQLNITFSQSDYWDQTLPMRMASAMKHEWLFKALDNGLWLYDVDDVTRMTGGNVLYYGTAHGNSLYKYLNYSHLGLVHSGQLGDVVLATTKNADNAYIPYIIGGGAYSSKYLNKIHLENDEGFNNEVGMFYFRYLNGTNNGLQIIYNYTESLSPFLDLDFLERVMAFPVALRQNHNIYKKWILNKYPKAAEFEWETTGQRIDTPTLRIANHEIPWKNIPRSISQHFRLFVGKQENTRSAKGMNPVAFYLANNTELKNYLDQYFEYTQIIQDKELREVINNIQSTGTAMEKIQAISLLAAIKLFYN